MIRTLILSVLLIVCLGFQGGGNRRSAGPDPIFRVEFEGGTSDCTDSGHCTSAGSACATADDVDIDCNATASASPSGGAYASGVCSSAGRLQFDAVNTGFDERSLYVKFWLKADGPQFTDPLFFKDAGNGTPGCGNYDFRLGNATTISARACGSESSTTHTRDGTWEEWKIHIDADAGDMSIWIPGSDFSGAASLVQDSSPGTPEDFSGFRLDTDSSCTTQDTDDIRFYNEDPD